MATSTKKTTKSSTVHQYVSTTPTASLPTYEAKTYKSSTYNKGIPDAYKATKYKADTYTGPTYNAQTYKSNYKLGNYESKYMPEIEQRVNDIANWKYDPLQDASYQALAQVYGARGNIAAKNSLADAAALNGGYGTSYAVSAAQQARNQYNQELASMIPQLEQSAYNRASTGLNALMDLDQTQYGRYRDTEADKQWMEQNAQNVWGMNRDEAYRAVQNALDIFNTNTANKQWAAGMNQGERQFAYNSLWDIYNTKNANRQWVAGMNQGERQFGYNAEMDAAQLLNDYYKWAQDYNSGLYEWNYAQANKGSSGSGGGGSRSSGGGGYTGGGSTTSSSGANPSTPEGRQTLYNNALYTQAEEDLKKNAGKVAGKEATPMYVNFHTKYTDTGTGTKKKK